MITVRRFLNESGHVALGPQFSYQMMSFVVCEDKLVVSPCVEGELCGFARKTNRYGEINIPRDALRESGISPNTHVDMAVNDSTIVIAKLGKAYKPAVPFTNHILELDPQLAYAPAKNIVAIPLNRGKQLRLPRWVMAQVGLEKDNMVVVQINNNKGIWLEVYPSTYADGSLETRMNAVARYRKHLMSFDGLKYLEIMNGSKIHIPSSFLQLFGDSWRDSSEINLWINEDKGCIVIEGPIRKCDLCTDDTRSLPTALVDVQLCPDCMLPPDDEDQSTAAPPPAMPPPPDTGAGKGKAEALVEELMKVNEGQNELLKQMGMLTQKNGNNDIENLEHIFDTFVQNDHTPLNALGLSVRALHALYRKGIETIADLCRCTEKDLMGIANFGKLCLTEVTEVLAARGLALKPEGKGAPKWIIADDVKSLRLSPRVYNALMQNHIKTISGLCNCTATELMRFRNFGKKCLNEVIEALDDAGLKLA